MSLLYLVAVLIIVGIGLWALNTYGTMVDGKIKQIINAVVIIVVLLWLVSIFFGPLPDIRVGPIGR
jgi:low temperature requirement protein LtrA